MSLGRVVVLRSGALGDFVATLPVLAAVRARAQVLNGGSRR